MGCNQLYTNKKKLSYRDPHHSPPSSGGVKN